MEHTGIVGIHPQLLCKPFWFALWTRPFKWSNISITISWSISFCVYAIAIEPIKVQTHSVSQNDHLNLSFVKDTYGNAEKMARKGSKMVIYGSQILRLTLYMNFEISNRTSRIFQKKLMCDIISNIKRALIRGKSQSMTTNYVSDIEEK